MGLAAVLLLLAAAGASAGPAVDGRGYVMGLQNPEDLVPVPATQWLVTSGLRHGQEPGKLFLVSREAKIASILYPDDRQQGIAQGQYSDCPGPPDAAVFSAHGLALRGLGDGLFNLYVVNHGGREALEVFRLDAARAARPTIQWIGCVATPEHSIANGVAVLPDGMLAVTVFVAADVLGADASIADKGPWMARLRAGETTGYAALWRAGSGWTRIPGTESSGPNGIIASEDGRELWIAIWGERTLTRVAPGAPHEAARRYPLAFMPDNLRRGDDGGIWVAGAAATPEQYFDCWGTAGCRNAFAIARIDPVTGTIAAVAHPQDTVGFGDATTAVAVGRTIWVGASPGDRLLYFEQR